MTNAGILQPDGTRCYSGPTCSRHGAHNRAVINSAQDLAKNFVEEAKAEFRKEQDERDFLNQNGFTTQELAELSKGTTKFSALPNLSETISAPVSYDYDYYETPDHLDDFDGYGRNRKYSGLHICQENLDAENIAEAFFEPKNASAKRVATAYVKKTRLDDAFSYIINTTQGYYGEEATEKVVRFFAKFENARDEVGTYSYLNSKGYSHQHDTLPVEDLFEYLKQNNVVGLPKSIDPNEYYVTQRSFKAKDITPGSWKSKATTPKNLPIYRRLPKTQSQA